MLLTKRQWVRSAYIAEDADGRIVGFAAAGPTRVASLGPAGELYAIYVLPQWQRLGLGRQLFHRAVESLVTPGVDAIVTWVFAANPSSSFFESLGGTMVASTSSRSGLPKVAYAYRQSRDRWPVGEADTRG
jgi:GNAT superfamily N-acetyltransferase